MAAVARLRPAVLVALAASSCTSAPRAASEGDPARALPRAPLERRIAVLDEPSGRPIDFESMLDRAAEADVVFVGETHLDETTHEVERAVLVGLAERRRGDVVLAMEMFERDVQAALDDYLAGTIDEAAFLERARPWPNYATAYRPLVEEAKRRGLAVVASNVPAAIRRRIARGGEEAYRSLSDAERRLVATRLLDESEAYWRRVDNAVRGHSFGSGGDRRFSGQSLWDNTMAESIADALDAHPGSLVLHVNGGFHSAYHDGTVRQLRLRRPELDVVTIDVTPVLCPQEAAGRARPDERPVADFIVAAASRARDLREGTHGVLLESELRYRLHRPDAPGPLPLVVWLGDDGASAEEGLALWRERLGDAALVAAVEAPNLDLTEDLVWAGRWFRPGEAVEGTGGVTAALERLVGYLVRRLGADPTRVCLLGEGSGATTALLTGLRADAVAWHVVAVAPRHGREIREQPLPLAERGEPTTPALSFDIFAREGDLPDGELEAWRREALVADLHAPTTDPVALDDAVEALVRDRLGLPPRRPAPRSAGTAPPLETSRARLWARVLAAAGVTPRPIDPDTLAHRGVVPPAPGPFGGTTVLVVPEDRLADFAPLEEHDPLAAHSRFHRLRLATLGGERPLGEVLDRLAEEGRRNVLVVPAEFCADAERMRAIRSAVGDRAERLTVAYRPGLGDRLARIGTARKAANGGS